MKKKKSYRHLNKLYNDLRRAYRRLQQNQILLLDQNGRCAECRTSFRSLASAHYLSQFDELFCFDCYQKWKDDPGPPT